MASALVVGIAYLVFGTRDAAVESTPTATAASPSSPTPLPSPTPESPTATAPSSPPGSPTSAPPSDSAPLPSPHPTTTEASGSAPADPTASPSDEDEPAETAQPAGTIELNDTSFVAPEGWVLYGDDLVEGDRRVVRLSEISSDARLQALTLLQNEDLTASCEALMAAQRGQYAVTSEQLARPVSVAPATGTGVGCGFSGVRSSDGVANTVSFTLLRRATDSHVLMLRTTIPDAIGVGDQARRDLTRMSCGASIGFGVPLPLC